MALPKAEFGYYADLRSTETTEICDEDLTVDYEMAAVGAGLGGRFGNTRELKVMQYKEATKENPVNWEMALKEEHDRMVKHKVWRLVKMSDVPVKAKILTLTWAMKKKSNGTYRARINGRGYEQIEGQHYAESSIHTLVTNDYSVRIVMILAVMASLYGKIVDAKGAFLNEHLDHEKEKVYTHMPKGFKRYYLTNVYLLLMKALHGIKQAAMFF